jgi:hypothetical protein
MFVDRHVGLDPCLQGLGPKAVKIAVTCSASSESTTAFPGPKGCEMVSTPYCSGRHFYSSLRMVSSLSASCSGSFDTSTLACCGRIAPRSSRSSHDNFFTGFNPDKKPPATGGEEAWASQLQPDRWTHVMDKQDERFLKKIAGGAIASILFVCSCSKSGGQVLI